MIRYKIRVLFPDTSFVPTKEFRLREGIQSRMCDYGRIRQSSYYFLARKLVIPNTVLEVHDQSGDVVPLNQSTCGPNDH